MNKYLRTFANQASFFQAIKIGLVGVLNTVVSLAMFNVFLVLLDWGWFWSLTVSFALTTFMSYVLNRRWTFELKDGKVSGKETATFFGINVAAYVLSAVIVWTADQVFGPLDDLGYNVALIFAAGLLILPKLAGYRDVVFSKALSEEDESESTELEQSRVRETPTA
jgi:putative flippase GtrA